MQQVDGPGRGDDRGIQVRYEAASGTPLGSRLQARQLAGSTAPAIDREEFALVDGAVPVSGYLADVRRTITAAGAPTVLQVLMVRNLIEQANIHQAAELFRAAGTMKIKNPDILDPIAQKIINEAASLNEHDIALVALGAAHARYTRRPLLVSLEWRIDQLWGSYARREIVPTVVGLCHLVPHDERKEVWSLTEQLPANLSEFEERVLDVVARRYGLPLPGSMRAVSFVEALDDRPEDGEVPNGKPGKNEYWSAVGGMFETPRNIDKKFAEAGMGRRR